MDLNPPGGQGSWARCAVRLGARESTWLGLGEGHGHLRGRVLRVAVSRPAAPVREATLLLPGPEQEVVCVGQRDDTARSGVGRTLLSRAG